jgi:hypothetical protein
MSQTFTRQKNLHTLTDQQNRPKESGFVVFKFQIWTNKSDKNQKRIT